MKVSPTLIIIPPSYSILFRCSVASQSPLHTTIVSCATIVINNYVCREISRKERLGNDGDDNGVDSNNNVDSITTSVAQRRSKGQKTTNSGIKCHKTDDKLLSRREQQQEDKNRHRSQKERSRRIPISLSKEEVRKQLDLCQYNALMYVEGKAKVLHENALDQLKARVNSFPDFSSKDIDACLDYIRDEAPIVIHFTEETLSLINKDTHYRNFFETNTTAGSGNNYKDKRELWETNMFGGHYNKGCLPSQRVKYGCLNVTGNVFGVLSAGFNFGWLYVILAPHCRHRATFFNKDSYYGFDDASSGATLATNEFYAHVLHGYSDHDLKVALSISRVSARRRGGAQGRWSIVTDRTSDYKEVQISDYKEVQIHGPVSLAHDIQALCLPDSKKYASAHLKREVKAFQKLTGCHVFWDDDLLDMGKGEDDLLDTKKGKKWAVALSSFFPSIKLCIPWKKKK